LFFSSSSLAFSSNAGGSEHEGGEEEDVTRNAGTFGEEPTPFSTLGLGPWLVDALAAGGKTLATRIQALSIPPILAGEDVVFGSETGAGKTLAYLLPLFERAARAAADQERQRRKEKEWEWFQERRAAVKARGSGESLTSLAQDFPWEAPLAIVLVPNRQLGEQVLRMAREVLEHAGGSGGGGGSGGVMIDTLPGSVEGDWPYHPKSRPAPSVLVCTPAALSGFDREIGVFERVETLVVDEADMLLEGDYGRHLDRILVAFKRCGLCCREWFCERVG
jgi:superfamily II DNA/RNA helicase